MADDDDYKLSMMQLALDQARSAALMGEAPIGAVIADPATGMVVSTAGNAPIMLRDATAHAEILAIRAAGGLLSNYRLTGLDLFVTLEPCAMCAGAISHARLGRVVFGADDAKGGAVVSGSRFFEGPTCHWRPKVESGLFAAESGEILRSFFKARRN